MKTRRLKLIFTVAFSIIIIGVLLIRSLYLKQEKNLDEITESLLNYYFVSCPNGNTLHISEQNGLKYSYEVVKYNISLYENSGSISYRSKTDIWGNTDFYRSGLFSGSLCGKSDMDSFPQCVIEVNDSLYDQRLFYPTFDNSEIKTVPSDSGKIYVSFEQGVSYDKALEIIEDTESCGTVTWLWVDTYGQNDMSDNPITLQNSSYKNDALPVHGIPMYYDGQKVENPLNSFLEILNGVSTDDNENQIDQKIFDIKSGINNSDTAISKEDINIIGMVVLPSKSLDKKQIFDTLIQKDNIKCCI